MVPPRKINTFEKILLPVGIAVTLFGFILLVQTEDLASASPTGWVRLTAIFCWLMLIFVMILAATNVDLKEELAQLAKEHTLEIKLLKEIVHDQLIEMKELRKELTGKKGKK